MHFTADEFHTMVQELLYTSPSRFDMLCEMAQRTLTPMVAGWCRRDTTLCGRGLEEDVMQGILLHLMKKTVHGFLLNDRAEGLEELENTYRSAEPIRAAAPMPIPEVD